MAEKQNGDIRLSAQDFINIAVVVSWLVIALATAVIIIITVLKGGILPDLDILERVIGWVGAPALIIIYKAVESWQKKRNKDDKNK